MARMAFEFKIDESTPQGRIRGFASTYGNIDEGGDVVVPGAFAKSLAQRDTYPLLWSHDMSMPIGKATLSDQKKGLAVDAQLMVGKVTKATEAFELAQAGVLGGFSIGYKAVKSQTDPKTYARRLEDVKLFEVSLVAVPMNPLAGITAIKQIESPRQLEEILRDAGFSIRDAKALTAGGYAALRGLRDAGDTEAAQLREAAAAFLAAANGSKH